MENSYGIGVTNRYALFYDESEDHLDILKQQEERQIERKKSRETKKKSQRSGENEPPAKTETTNTNEISNKEFITDENE